MAKSYRSLYWGATALPVSPCSQLTLGLLWCDGSMSTSDAADLLINWDAARTTAARLAPPGPALSRRAAHAEVEALRTAAAESVGHVHRITGLDAAEGLGEDLSDVLITDRAGWSSANTSSFRELLAPALETMVQRRPEMMRRGSNAQVFGSTAAGAELGAVLGFLSAQVLGQFDPFHSSEKTPHGRLMLVAPNVVSVAQQLNVDRADFRLWVCLHEQTHRVQFAAAPWLGDHLKEQISTLTTHTMGMTDSLPQRLAEAAKTLAEEMRAQRGDRHAEPLKDQPKNQQGDQNHEGGTTVQAQRRRLLDLVQSPEDRAIMSHLTAVMSLLEGHANVVMDAIDSSVVPTVKTIRRRFEDRSARRSPLQKLVRRLLQLDLKAAQYRDGQKFVDRVVTAVGMEAFNTVWESAEHLPTETELHDPDQWVARLGLRAP